MKKTLAKITLGIATLAACWVLGLILFVWVIQSDMLKSDTKTDAIIVLTGGAFRIETGIDLYRAKHAHYLYISGVDPGTDVIDRIKSNGVSDQDLSCCVVIESLAKDTNDNAYFTNQWIRKQHIESATIVTANYHMPRSLVEFSLLDGHTQLYPFSITPESVMFKKWWAFKGSRELIVEEYNKFLFAGLKLCLIKLLNLVSL